MSTDLLPIGDMTPRLVTTLQGNPGRVMQSFVRAPWSGEYFEAQVESGDGATSDLRISRCDASGKRLDYAILAGAGHGSSITAEYSDGKVWIWLFWGADVASAQGDAVRWAYSGTPSGARVLQADTEPVADPGIGATGHTYGKFAIDQQTDRIATAFRSGSTETFALYKLSDYKAAGPEGTPPTTLKTASVTWPAGSAFQGFTIDGDASAYISRGGSSVTDVPPTLYQLDWATGAIVGSKDVSDLAKVAGNYASGGHNEAEGICLWRDQSGTPELLFGIDTGPIYSRRGLVFRMAAPVDGSATKTLLLDLEKVTGGVMDNAVVDIRYDRLVRHSTGGMTPKPATEPVKLSEKDRVQVFAADHETLTDDSYGFVMYVRSAWDDPSNPGRRVSDTWTAQVSAADPDVVALSSVLVAEGAVPAQAIRAVPGPPGPPGTDGLDGGSDPLTASYMADASSDTRAALDELYVPQSLLVPVSFTLPGFHQDALTVTTGPVVITLGGDPLPGSLLAFDGGKAVSATLSGRELSLTAATTSVRLLYAYDHSAGEPTNAAVKTIIADSFNRADNATSLGGTEQGGKTWQALSGTWGISSNQAYRATYSSTAANDSAAINAGSADVTMQVKFAAGAPGAFVRATDADNMIDTNLTALYRRESGTNNSIGTFSTAFALGDTIRIVTSGTNIKVYRQAASAGAFAQVLSTTSTFNQSATLHGIRTAGAAGTARWDDFQVIPA